MQIQQDHYSTALSSQAELFNRLSDQLDKWSDLIIIGKHDPLADSLDSNELNSVFESVHKSRSALRMLGQPSSLSFQEQEALNQLLIAQARLTQANDTLRALIQRGLLFTQTMLCGITEAATADSVYDEHARANWPKGNSLRGEA